MAHIEVATAIFFEGTTGTYLDALGRNQLHRVGLEIAHGIGHGVGACLGVHEWPYAIRQGNMAGFKAGVIVSNEPGVYIPDQWGFRIENLEEVVPCAMPKADRELFRIDNITGAKRELLRFEPLTMVPIDTRLVDRRLVGPERIRWLNDYHRRVRSTMLPHVDQQTAAWIKNATRPL